MTEWYVKVVYETAEPLTIEQIDAIMSQHRLIDILSSDEGKRVAVVTLTHVIETAGKELEWAEVVKAFGAAHALLDNCDLFEALLGFTIDRMTPEEEASMAALMDKVEYS